MKTYLALGMGCLSPNKRSLTALAAPQLHHSVIPRFSTAAINHRSVLSPDTYDYGYNLHLLKGAILSFRLSVLGL